VDPRGKRRRVRWLCSILLLVCSAVSARAAGEYRTIEIESLKITIDSEWGARTAPGYLPVRFDITNLGEARVIDIVGHGTRFFRTPFRTPMSTQGGIEVRQAVRLARGDRVRLTIPVPIYASNENIRFEIHEDGRILERFNYTGFQSGTLPADASALIVADRAMPFGTMAAKWSRPMSGPTMSGPVYSSSGTVIVGPTGRFPSGSGGTPPALDFLLDPARLPTNWLGYTSLRAVVIGPAEWEQLTDPQKNALLTWTACGGDLIFVDGDPSALLPGGQKLAAGAGEPAVRAYLFGRIHWPTSESIATARLGGILSAAEKLQDANFALPANRARDWGSITARGFRLPIPGVDGVPARAYLSILIVFALLIGPVNYWFLWRKQQQVLLVLTAPLISMVFIVLLGGYVLAGEGLGVRARAVTFTMLDQVRKQAATRGSVSLYAAGMTPFGGLRFRRDVAVFPIGPDGTGSRERQALDLTDLQRFSAGGIQARSPTNLEQIGFRTARERLSFSREAGGMAVVNGLGATVSALLYREGDTVYTLTGLLPSGGRGILKIAARGAGNIVPSDLPQSSRFVHLVENQPSGSYLAVLERSPFWDPGVSGIVERGSFHLVIGWPEGQP
jgi:hypothetical protein